MAIEFDDSSWPVVVCRAVGDSTDEDIRTYTSVLGEYLARGERHIVIVDARSGKSLSSKHRRFIAEWNKKNARALSLYRGAVLLVTPSSLLRGMITAVHWLFPAPFPYKAVEDFEQARALVDEYLGERPMTTSGPMLPSGKWSTRTDGSKGSSDASNMRAS
jgi:transcriptional regulator GlxA family with amidase domain